MLTEWDSLFGVTSLLYPLLSLLPMLEAIRGRSSFAVLVLGRLRGLLAVMVRAILPLPFHVLAIGRRQRIAILILGRLRGLLPLLSLRRLGLLTPLYLLPLVPCLSTLPHFPDGGTSLGMYSSQGRYRAHSHHSGHNSCQ